jgi:hypothetical protein
LPKKTNVHGCGYLSIVVGDSPREKHIEVCGQFFNYYAEIHDVEDFINPNADIRFMAFISLLEHTVNTIHTQYDIDIQHFSTAIASLRNNGTYLEYPLEISRWHPHRKVKVEFIRAITPLEEKILIRVSTKQCHVLKEDIVQEHSSIYDVAYDFRKSTWNGNRIEVYDRFERLTFSDDISEFVIT